MGAFVVYSVGGWVGVSVCPVILLELLPQPGNSCRDVFVSLSLLLLQHYGKMVATIDILVEITRQDHRSLALQRMSSDLSGG